ncbi:hypothetical protein HanIR_Chr01g0031361 [Helianthus annuus]|nr:hypothetical protein HanIR_Chr01g0031361 [Helianthus annuus]
MMVKHGVKKSAAVKTQRQEICCCYVKKSAAVKTQRREICLLLKHSVKKSA